MKKTLALAAFGLLCVGSHAFALSVQETKNYTSLTKGGTTTANGKDITWSGDVITGLANAHDIQITLNHTWNLGTNGKVDLIYATNTGGNKWGLYAYEDGKIHGKDNGNTYGTAVEKSTITALSGYPTGGTGLILSANIGYNGVHLKSKDENTVLYSQGGLKYTGNNTSLSSITVNSAYITGIAAYDYMNYKFKNSDESWTKESTSLNTYKVTSGETRFTNTAKADANKDIVIGDSGLLFLQTNLNNEKGNVAISNDIYLGKSSSTYDSIHFGNNATEGYTTEISGDIYLVESAAISSRGENAVNITGKVTDKNVSGSTKADGGYTLTVKGKGYNFAGDVTVAGLEFVAGTQAQFGKGFNATSVTLGGANTNITSDAIVGLTNLTVNAAGATLDAALQLSGGTLTMGASLAMGDNALVLNSMVLSGSLYDSLATALAEEGASVTLFTGVTGLSFDVASGIATEFTPVAAESVFTNLSQGAYLINLEQGNVTLTAAPAVPEPTTATLSLLALAGLAARRRRR